MTDSSHALDLYSLHSAHLIGIGGTAMTPLATILLQMGLSVSGSDLNPNAAMEPLRRLGATIEIGHRAENVGNVDVVIASSAVPGDNPEALAARERGIPLIKHSAALGSLMRRRRGIAIAGTHGKTTTSALTAFILDAAGLDPTFHVGSELLNFGLFGRRGTGELFVAEADEYDRRFLDYDPEIAVITSIEPDHLDYFGDFEHVVGAFQDFVARVRPGGAVIVSADDPIASTLRRDGIRRISYGHAEDADWRIERWAPAGHANSEVTLRGPDGARRSFELGLLGRHNAENAAAVVAVCEELGVPWEHAAAGLATFRGTKRRFEVVGESDGVTVVDDYAHHPTAIRVTLAAARAHFASPIWAVFQPHTAHRTVSLFDEFASSFVDADHVVIAPTYRPPGREEEAEDPTIQRLVNALGHADAVTLPPDEAASRVATRAEAGDLVLVMGAGDIWGIEQKILTGLSDRRSQP